MTEETKMVLERIGRIDDKLDRVIERGCAKADAHVRIEDNQNEIFRRLTAVENAQAEGRGKLAITMLIITAFWGVVCIWIGKKIG